MSVTFTVCIDWDNDGSFATGGDDITAYVKLFQSRNGITEEAARVADIGQCVLTLDNADKRFSPLYSSGPLYGKLLPNLPVRIQATSGGSTWTLFYGHTRSFVPDPGVLSARECRVVCEDALSTLHRAKVAMTLQENKTPDELIQLVLNQTYGSAHAYGTFTFTANPSADETVTIGTKTFTFKATAASAYEVTIGTAKEDTAQNLMDAINALTTQSSYASGAGCSASLSSAAVVRIAALEPGTYGNSIALAESSAGITVSAATLENGTDAPSGLVSLDAGKSTFLIAADRWAQESTRAINAIADCVVSEYGLFWVARDGTLTFKNRDYEFLAPASAASLTVDGHGLSMIGALDEARIKNRMIVEYTPRETATSTTVVAAANSTITVPGSSGTERWNKEQGYVGSTGGGAGVENPSEGDKIVRIPYRDVDAGQIIAATDLIVPVPNTDFTANEFSDGSGVDYTTSSVIGISLVASGSGVECSFVNTATGSLYFFDFQVRGKAIVAFDPVQEIREDTTSITAYGLREYTYKLPLPSLDTFAESLAVYLLSRYKTPVYIASQMVFREPIANSVELLSLEIGDVITISDAQTGMSSKKYLITGTGYTGRKPADDISPTFYLRPIDDQTYWILDDSTYSVLGSTTRPAV